MSSSDRDVDLHSERCLLERMRTSQGIDPTSVRHLVTFHERRFDVKQLPVDIQRVYGHLKKQFGEDYALAFVFVVQTATELHRAWHMSLLTSKILQQVKEKFNLRTTWELGVLRIKFRVEDGAFELHRKVPYDYDSEFQDNYYQIAVALIEGHIDIQEALIFQTETKQGLHTAQSGLFLRDFPGRLVLYPLEAATCTVIFFGGDWQDAGVAALCGLAAGLIDNALSSIGGEAKVLVDILVGISTGTIAGLFFRYFEADTCVSGIFLGTLYWFFYGTAFVIGLLEIIAGELQTGVTRFIAVTVKTFVLCLGASVGLLIVSFGAFEGKTLYEAYLKQEESCNTTDLSQVWWRIPLYLLCSASALGQYRFPVVDYWRGLAVQLAGYEVQYRVNESFKKSDFSDIHNLDNAASNILGAMAAVVTACALSYTVDNIRGYYNARILQRSAGETSSKCGECVFSVISLFIRLFYFLRIGNKSDYIKLTMVERLEKESKEIMSSQHSRTEIVLDPEEERVLMEAIVFAESHNIWAVLMPAVYQLVPGSIIAKLWLNSIFPPGPIEIEKPIMIGGNATNSTYILLENDPDANVFSTLMVIATSLALGLILGFALVQVCSQSIRCKTDNEKAAKRADERHVGMFTTPEDDPVPDDENDESVKERLEPVQESLFETDEPSACNDPVSGGGNNDVEGEDWRSELVHESLTIAENKQPG